MPKYIIDVPNPYDSEGAWITYHETDTKKEALDYVQKTFGADEEGNINLITEVKD